MGKAEDFEKWMEEEDKRMKNYKFEVIEEKEEKITKPYQLDLFER